MQRPKVCLQNINDIISYTVSSYCNFQIRNDLIMIQKCVLKMGFDREWNGRNTPTLIFENLKPVRII